MGRGLTGRPNEFACHLSIVAIDRSGEALHGQSEIGVSRLCVSGLVKGWQSGLRLWRDHQFKAGDGQESANDGQRRGKAPTEFFGWEVILLPSYLVLRAGPARILASIQ